MNVSDISITPPPVYLPEFAPLPTRGLCPHTGLSRSGLYRLEHEGVIKLARLRRRGCTKGRTLVPVPQVLAYLRDAVAYGRQEASA